MKKSLLVFVGIMAMILGSTTFVSCGSDDDDDTPTKKEYVFNYATSFKIAEDVLKIYDNVVITFTYPDGNKDIIPLKVTSGAVSYDSKKTGNVSVEINGTLKEDVVEDDKDYDMSISYDYRSNSGSETMTLGQQISGFGLKEVNKELSSVAGYKHTFTK